MHVRVSSNNALHYYRQVTRVTASSDLFACLQVHIGNPQKSWDTFMLLQGLGPRRLSGPWEREGRWPCYRWL